MIELGSHDAIEAFRPKPVPLYVLDQRRLNRWISSLEQSAGNDDRLRSQASYVRSVNIIFLTTPQDKHQLASYASLCNTLVLLDHKSGNFYSFNVEDDGPLELGCKSLAEEWLKTHSQSKPAQMIVLLGLSASSGTHFRFVAELYQEATAKNVSQL